MPIPNIERFLEILVHDLRGPLNVLKLTLHMLNEMARPSESELADDVFMMRQNIDEIDRMLIALVDYVQLPAKGSRLDPMEFNPARLLRELVELRTESTTGPEIHLETQDGPASVLLDPSLTRHAWSRALENAATAAGDKGPVRVTLRGGPDRCRVEMTAETPPRESVVATELHPDHYQRILGNAAERRGIDLALVAMISALFGGQARLDVEPGTRTTLVIDWPRAIGATEPA